jgi:hypothetical protein
MARIGDCATYGHLLLRNSSALVCKADTGFVLLTSGRLACPLDGDELSTIERECLRTPPADVVSFAIGVLDTLLLQEYASQATAAVGLITRGGTMAHYNVSVSCS